MNFFLIPIVVMHQIPPKILLILKKNVDIFDAKIKFINEKINIYFLKKPVLGGLDSLEGGRGYYISMLDLKAMINHHVLKKGSEQSSVSLKTYIIN